MESGRVASPKLRFGPLATSNFSLLPPWTSCAPFLLLLIFPIAARFIWGLAFFLLAAVNIFLRRLGLLATAIRLGLRFALHACTPLSGQFFACTRLLLPRTQPAPKSVHRTYRRKGSYRRLLLGARSRRGSRGARQRTVVSRQRLVFCSSHALVFDSGRRQTYLSMHRLSTTSQCLRGVQHPEYWSAHVVCLTRLPSSMCRWHVDRTVFLHFIQVSAATALTLRSELAMACNKITCRKMLNMVRAAGRYSIV